MSGRPANPSYTPIVFDVGNYSAGTNAWSGTAKRTDPGYRAFTPGVLDAPQFHNFFFGSAFDVQALQKTDAQNAINLAGQLPALNWQAKTATSKQVSNAAWSAIDQTWWACGLGGGADAAVYSQDGGHTWVVPTLGSALGCLDVAIDASGDVVIVTTSRTVYKGTRSAYGSVSFVATSNALSFAPSSSATVAYDATHGKWLAFYQPGASGVKLDTSADGVTWASQTLPAGWTTSLTSIGPTATQVNANASGTAIIANFDASLPGLRIASSTDGGTTWTQRFAAALAFTPTVLTRPTYDDVSGIWYLAASATGHTSILKSTDGGVTWTTVKTFTATDIFANGLATLGTLLVLLNYDGRVLYSTDGAATWYLGTRNAPTTLGTSAAPLSLRGGGGGLLALDFTDTAAWASHRFDGFESGSAVV